MNPKTAMSSTHATAATTGSQHFKDIAELKRNFIEFLGQEYLPRRFSISSLSKHLTTNASGQAVINNLAASDPVACRELCNQLENLYTHYAAENVWIHAGAEQLLYEINKINGILRSDNFADIAKATADLANFIKDPKLRDELACIIDLTPIGKPKSAAPMLAHTRDAADTNLSNYSSRTLAIERFHILKILSDYITARHSASGSQIAALDEITSRIIMQFNDAAEGSGASNLSHTYAGELMLLAGALLSEALGPSKKLGGIGKESSMRRPVQQIMAAINTSTLHEMKDALQAILTRPPLNQTSLTGVTHKLTRRLQEYLAENGQLDRAIRAELDVRTSRSSSSVTLPRSSSGLGEETRLAGSGGAAAGSSSMAAGAHALYQPYKPTGRSETHHSVRP